MNNKIEILVDLGKQLTLKLKFDGNEANLDLNPELLLNPIVSGNVDIVLSSSSEELQVAIMDFTDDEVIWSFPVNKDYMNLSGIELRMDKVLYLNVIQDAIYEIVRKTNFNTGVNRRDILISGGNLGSFLSENRSKILETLSLEE